MSACDLVVTDEQDRVAVDPAVLQRVLDAACRRMGRSMRLSVAIVDDETIAGLHERFLGISGPTDVLSFPLPPDGEPDPGEPGEPTWVEGEVVVSADTAHRTATELGVPPAVEVCLYALHGLLHLLGQDDHEPGDFLRMHGLEREIIQGELGIDPRAPGATEGGVRGG